MGYTTYFSGSFELDKPLEENQRLYLEKFAETRRMQRDPEKVEKFPDPVREAVGLPVGTDGEFYVNAEGWAGQDRDESITEYNYPPRTQPSLWCQWVPTPDGKEIVWDEGEKFYEYTAWIEYIIANFLEPWGYKLNGSVRWEGEESNDRGTIWIKDNQIQAIEDQIISPEPEWN